MEEEESTTATMRVQSHKFTGRSQIITSMFLDDDSVSEPSTYDYPVVTDYTPSSPAKVRPAPVRRFKLYSRSLTTPANKLLLGDRNYMDMAAFKGGSFKVGWSSGTSFYTIEKTSIVNFKLVPLVDNDKDPFKPVRINWTWTIKVRF